MLLKMLFNILLYLPMAFYIIQCSSATDADIQQLKDQLARSKTNVLRITSGIKRLKTELQLTGNSELTIPTLKSKQVIHNIIEATQSQITKDVKEAVKNGKNKSKVENCMKHADTRLLLILENKENVIEKCQEGATKAVAIQISQLNAAHMRGVRLLSQLNSVHTRCANGNPLQVQKCYGARLREINPNIGIFETDAEKTKVEAQTTVTNVLKTLKQCNSEVVGSARVQTGKVKHETAVCLQHA